MNAIALNSAIFMERASLARRLPESWSPALARVGFFVNAVSYRRRPTHDAVKAHKLAAHGPHLQHIVEGFRFVKRTGPILTLLLLLGLVSLVLRCPVPC